MNTIHVKRDGQPPLARSTPFGRIRLNAVDLLIAAESVVKSRQPKDRAAAVKKLEAIVKKISTQGLQPYKRRKTSTD